MPDPLIDESAPLAVKLIRDRSILIGLLVQASTKLALRDREILELRDYLGQISNFLDEEEREPEETVETIRNELNGLESERDAALARVRELTESNARLLAELGNASARIQELQEGNDMACESPPVGCDCPGCSLARELAKEAPRG